MLNMCFDGSSASIDYLKIVVHFIEHSARCTRIDEQITNAIDSMNMYRIKLHTLGRS